MIVVADVDAESAERFEVRLDFLFSWIAAHVAEVFVLGSGQDFVNHPCEFIGDCHLGFIFRAQAEAELVVFGAVKALF